MLSALPKEVFQNMSNLEILNLRGNKIANLSAGAFVGLSKLKQLYLYNNLLNTLPDGIFQDLLNLERLDLYGNQISKSES